MRLCGSTKVMLSWFVFFIPTGGRAAAQADDADGAAAAVPEVVAVSPASEVEALGELLRCDPSSEAAVTALVRAYARGSPSCRPSPAAVAEGASAFHSFEAQKRNGHLCGVQRDCSSCDPV